jgi:hypothetical protein
LKLAVVAGLAWPRAGIVGAQDDAQRKARPQPNDRLVFAAATARDSSSRWRISRPAAGR